MSLQPRRQALRGCIAKRARSSRGLAEAGTCLRFTALAELLAAIVEEMPDATSTSRSAVQRALFRLGFSRKKSFVAVERDTPERRERREEFCALLKKADLSSLVFIDESFVKTGMRREYGRSLRGHRVTGTRPFRSWKTISLVGALRLGEKPKIMTSKAAVDGPTFLRFVKRRLGPWIYLGDIVIMDNLSIHKMPLSAKRSSMPAAFRSTSDPQPGAAPDRTPLGGHEATSSNARPQRSG